jgi:hypothetical protein
VNIIAVIRSFWTAGHGKIGRLEFVAIIQQHFWAAGEVIFIEPSRQALISSNLSTEIDIRNLRRKQQEFGRAWEASRSLLKGAL